MEYVNGDEGFWCFFACCRDFGPRGALGIGDLIFYCYLKESFLLKGFEDEDGIEQSLSEEVEIG